MGQLEASHAISDGAGESPFAMAEQFALEQIFRDRSAVHRHKGLAGATGFTMYELRHQFFTGAALASDHDRGRRVGDARQQRAQCTDRFAASNDLGAVIHGLRHRPVAASG